MSKEFTLPYGIKICCADNGSASITSDLRAEFLVADRPLEQLSADDRAAEGFIDGVESLLLALANAGVDLNQPAFASAIDTAVEAFSNNND